ncbi:MAG: ATP-binding protein [bacterium]
MSHAKYCEIAGSLTERTFNADASEIATTIGFVAKLAKNAGLDSGKISRLELAIEEATSNICGHAYLEEASINRMSYAYQKHSAYTVAITNKPDAFTVRMTDSGVAFNPLLVALPDVSLPVEVRQADGLGILLMRNMVDDVRYERTGGRNILTLAIHKP